MNYFKRAICIVLCFVMLQNMAINAFAVGTIEKERDTNTDSFFAFDNSIERMESDGSFKFSFASYLSSDHFKPSEEEIEVSVTLWIRDIDDSPTWTDPWFPDTNENKSISVSLYKLNTGAAATLVDSFTVYATDDKTSKTFSDLTVGDTYYLYFNAITSAGTRKHYDGKGTVSDVTVLQ